MNAQVNDSMILFPVARIVQGDLYEPNTTDMQGNPLKTKSGENAGKDRVEYFFSYAIPKASEQIWWQTPWGAKVYGIAQAAWPTLFDRVTGQCNHPRFSWKIMDGDDATPNPDAGMKRNCDREGFPGHWVVRCSSGFKTRIFDEQGQPLLTDGVVKRGYWVEVYAQVTSNNNTQKPGLYINHSMVAYRAPGSVIQSGPDPRSVGFGRGALPAGVSAQPIGNVANMPAMPAAPGMPGAPAGVPQMPASAGYAAPAAPAAPPAPGGYAAPAAPAAPVAPAVPVQPAPAFIAPPVPGAAPAVPVAPATPAFVCPLGAPAGYKMVNLNGGRYEAFKQGGWTDPALVQHGHMVKL